MAVRFGPFSLDASRRQILHGRTPFHLTPKAFDLISILVTQAPRVVSKRELHDLLWPGTFVSDSSLTGLVKELRRVLQDDGLDVPVIRTVHRVGYACGLDVGAGQLNIAAARVAAAFRRRAASRLSHLPACDTAAATPAASRSPRPPLHARRSIRINRCGVQPRRVAEPEPIAHVPYLHASRGLEHDTPSLPSS